MLIINYMMKNKLIQQAPIYVTGLVDEVTAIHNAYPEMLSREVKEEILYKDENPFTSEFFKRIDGFKEDIANGELQ